MPGTPVITEDEWRAELDRLGVAEAEGRDDPGTRVCELMAMTGHGEDWVRENILRPGIAAGTIVVGRRVIRGIDGRVQHVPVYRPVEKPKQCPA